MYEQEYSDIIHLKGKLDNYHTRRWYKTHNDNIPNLIDKSQPMEQQAQQAHALRNKYKWQARELMEDQEQRKELDDKYPLETFEETVKRKMDSKNITREQTIEDIVTTAPKTNKKINKSFGLEE